MGDEESAQPKLRLQRGSRIIIRKCKKTSVPKQLKPVDDSKKVNGDLSTKSKVKESDDLVEIVKPKETRSKALAKSKKRKLSVSNEDDNVIVLEDASKVDETEDGSEKKDSSSVEITRSKKRILAPIQKPKDNSNTENSDEVKNGSNSKPAQEPETSSGKLKVIKISKAKKKKLANGKKGNEADCDDTQAESQAEYAQYLGLQPTMQFKCYRCGEKGFPSMLALNMHQRMCEITQKSNFLSNIQQDTTTSSDPNMLTNFRITRKVYLCSACGTYYENWNLFLHMRDVHKKHICLFCLTMFGMADKLADHLSSAHNVNEESFNSSEEFQNIYKGSCYLICCSCENMFNEREDYFHHHCMKRDPTAKCTLCGVKCGHYYTCPNSNQPRSITAVTSVTQSVPVPISKAQTSASLTKFVVPTSKKKVSEEIWMGKKGSSFHDDDYDISHAASFCHVDIADESGYKDKMGTKDDPVEISDDDKEVEREAPSNEKINSVESEKQKSDVIVADGDVLDKETVSEKSETANKSVEEPVKSLDLEENIIQTQDSSSKALTNASEKDISEKTTNEVHTEELLPNEDPVNKEGNEEGELPKEQVDKKVNFEKNSSQEECNAAEKVDICKDAEAEIKELNPSLEKVNKDVISSDSDEEPNSHSNVNQDSSESSSDESSREDTKSKPMNASNNETVTESDSDESKNLSNKSTDQVNNVTDKTEPEKQETSEEQNVSETHSNVTFSETPKDFSLDDVIGVNGPETNEDFEKKVAETPEPQEPLPTTPEEISDGIVLAGEDVPAMALTLENKLEEANSQSVVKECVRTSCLNCVYCSHAVKIAVNGKQLTLHLLAEHRYKPIKNNETSQDVVKKLKSSLNDLELLYFNTDSYDSSDKTLNAPYDYTYACFQCRFVTNVHKELYVHKRKMHQKTVLLCVMCKSNFYSYSELLCHMCPGIYASENITFRCCFCNLDLIPSAFRLMVHLRKSHHTCDTCLEVAGDQQKLSTHMWKHKLNHLCYRCGIAYRNKPDITKHLFWKHGTESVLCKKCLQKKWPHVYHFCIPPTVFICEECNNSFTKAVALKVHKRLHLGEFPYECSKCDQKFVSKKLQEKHEEAHNRPLPTENTNKSDTDNKLNELTDEHINVESVDEPSTENDVKDKDPTLNLGETGVADETKSKKKKKKDKDKKGKSVLDVYDFPPLNLSSESDSSDDDTKQDEDKKNQSNIDNVEQSISDEKVATSASEHLEPSEDNQIPPPVVDGVWDSFQTYKAELEKRECKDLPTLPNILPSTSKSETPIHPEQSVSSSKELPKEDPLVDWFLMEHSYCLLPGKPKPSENENDTTIVNETRKDAAEESPAPREHSSSIDHAYATLNNVGSENNTAVPTEKPSSVQTPSTPTKTESLPTESCTSSKKKKQKSPKKKKPEEHSSSSSDSSSDSDSSSCCSKCSGCNNCTSSSSSSSSDSDSSSPEGKQRAVTKKENKTERTKHKHQKDEPTPPSETLIEQPSIPEEEPVPDTPAEPIVLPIRESDLDTDESSTDEDFYDKHPQNHAKEQMEKRNLMLLASVAPINNGTVSPLPPPPVEKSPSPPAAKRKIKTKRRRKSQQSKKVSKSLASHQQTPAKPSTSTNLPIATSTPSHLPTNYQSLASKISSPLRTPASAFNSDAAAGSGSENESARLSKRKRVRNKFYGYSSEEEDQEKTSAKWRKTEPNPQSYQPPSSQNFVLPTSYRPPVTIPQARRSKPSESSGTDEEPPLVITKEDSCNSSSSSESETEFEPKETVLKEQTEKNDNLYCYCQCPYDEVSEMIACDGEDCTIEWFHFECVGIMVPPKGKWFCPDCRKRKELM